MKTLETKYQEINQNWKEIDLIDRDFFKMVEEILSRKLG